jgi:1-acyl-sn-glycerol-3-phosphate acyltransferase
MEHEGLDSVATPQQVVVPEVARIQTRARRVIKPVVNRLWNVTVEGLENLPQDGPAIVCPNHISFFDSVFTMVYVGRTICFVGKAEYMESRKTKYLFPALGMIPIDRSGGKKSEAALLAAEQVLKRGELFGIYPEGTRSRDGALYKGHTGAARLAMKVGCPIIPVGIVGTREIQPPNKVLPKPGLSCVVKFGRPIDVHRYTDRGGDHMVLREITDELMYEIRELSGQEYRNVYSTKHSESIPTDEAAVKNS